MTNKTELIEQIKELETWLSNRPSPSMDPHLDKVIEAYARLRKLKAKRRKERLPTRMMEAQQMREE